MPHTIELSPDPTQKSIVYANSRYNYHLIYTLPEDNKRFIQTFKLPEIRSRQTDLSYTVTPARAFRPDLIAYDFYDTPTLWWLIAIANGIMNPFDKDEGMYAGRVLIIPDMISASGV